MKKVSNYYGIAKLMCVLGVDVGGASSGGEVLMVVVLVVIGYWWLRSGGGSGGDSLCKGGSCNSCRNNN